MAADARVSSQTGNVKSQNRNSTLTSSVFCSMKIDEDGETAEGGDRSAAELAAIARVQVAVVGNVLYRHPLNLRAVTACCGT